MTPDAPHTECDAALGPTARPADRRNCRSTATCTACSSTYFLSKGSCQLKTCTCSGGTAATGTACPTHGSPKCVSCSSGRYLSSGSCPAWRASCSDAAGEYESVSPTTTRNRVCSTKICTCASGTGATGTACPTHNQAKCTACNSNHFLSASTCRACTVCDTSWQTQTQACGSTTDTQCDGKTSTSTTYTWAWSTPDPYGACSKTCGGGTQVRPLTCTKTGTKTTTKTRILLDDKEIGNFYPVVSRDGVD